LLLAGSLKLTGIIGVGAYGVVYTAIDIHTLIPYAVKALNKIGLDSRQRRFQQREIQLHHEASHHPNVVSLNKIMDSEDCTFVIMEYCPEGDLFTSITEGGYYVGNDHLIRNAFLQILDGVDFCHSIGVYHRDLKPENILVTDGGQTLKLADFGLATKDEVTSDFGCGSTFYMSPGRTSPPSLAPGTANERPPECQATAPNPTACYASGPNDVWSLGVVLVNLTCGRNPWKRASTEDATFRAYLEDPRFLSSILPLSAELDLILRRIFECNPARRIGIPELRELVRTCPRFTLRSTLPPTPPAEMNFNEAVVFQHVPSYQAPFEPFPASPYTPAPSPPAQSFSRYSQMTSASAESSPSDDGSLYSTSSSTSSSSSLVSNLETARLTPPCGPTPVPANFYGNLLPLMDWTPKAPHHLYLPSIPCC
jgi:serine/threonine protein kinase